MEKIPEKARILDWISENPTLTAKRDIAKAFGIKGAQRIDLKRILKELASEGLLSKHKKTYKNSDTLAPVSAIQIHNVSDDGDLFSRPLEWTGKGEGPVILLITGKNNAALGPGDKLLARLTAVIGQYHDYEARMIRRIQVGPDRFLGIFRRSDEGGRLVPIERSGKEWVIETADCNGAKDGELVEAEIKGSKARLGLQRGRILSRLGDPTAPRAVSLIAIHQHNIPDYFASEVILEAEKDWEFHVGERLDLRDMLLITIDPADARDHDDACFAHADEDPKNKGGHIIWVAIADVAHYVSSSGAIDKEARKRGNSTYFTDRVVPMLPEKLSADLCSLHEGVDRYCVAVKIKIDQFGEKISQTFYRAIMKSHASLSYENVQAAYDGGETDIPSDLLEAAIKPLYSAYLSLKIARDNREPLSLDLPERKIEIGEDGKIASIRFRERLDAHRLIEEFMVLANVASAEVLSDKNVPFLYRVHEEPSKEKLDALRQTAQSAGLTLTKGQVLKTAHLNSLLKQAKKTDDAELINMSTLRSMAQAYYSRQNFGHFGLALRSYAHFTSPIRRYSDLIVHRALVKAHGWGKDGLSALDEERLEETAQMISISERRSMVAERDTTDRYLSSYLSEREGHEFAGRISGVAKFGAFVRLDESGAEGLIPMRLIGREFFNLNQNKNSLTGSETGLVIALGKNVTVKLTETIEESGGITFELIEVEGKPLLKSRQSMNRSSKRNYFKAKGNRPKLTRNSKTRK